MHLTVSKKINIYCYLLYALYGIITLTIFGFGVYFLEEFQFSFIAIGTTIAISSLIASILQPVLGRLEDIKQYSWKNILIILSAIMLIASLGIFIAPKFLLILLFGVMVITLGCMYPFLNSAVFYYHHKGIETNFGISRGFASLSYMIFSIVIGFMLLHSSKIVINYFSVVALIIMILVLYLLPYYGSYESKIDRSKKLKDTVLFKYPMFLFCVISITLFMIFHNMLMGYLINIFQNVGGNIQDVSFANSLGALLELPTMFLFFKIIEKVSVKKLLIFASFCFIIRSLILLFAHNPMGIYFSFFFQILTYAIIIPASVQITDDIMNKKEKFEGQAIIGSTMTLGAIFAHFLGGTILQQYDVNMMLIVLVVITVLGFIFAVISMRYDQKTL